MVRVGSFFFKPANITINVGDTVIWSNTVSMAHDTTSDLATNVWSSPNLTTNNRTFAFRFTNGGYYPYICDQHINAHPEQTGSVSVVTAPNTPPTVALINPPNNAKFRAPANFALQATASDPGGSVTNLQFFANEVFSGSAPVAPYNLTRSNLAAGNYRLTAQATDNHGARATSAVVNVFVLTNARLTAPLRLPDGQFRFTLQGIAGQTYTTEGATNLQTWSAFATNVAPANSFNITATTAPNVLRKFYRARQDL